MFRFHGVALVLAAVVGCSGGGGGSGGTSPPTLTDFAPSSGTPGTSVVLTGSGLASETSVTFDGVPAQISATPTATSLTVIVPSGATANPMAR